MGCLFTCATSVLRIILFIFNFIFVLCGITLLVVGIVFKVQTSSVTDILHDDLDVGPILFIVMGSLIFLIAFLGCCGAIKQNSCMLSTYAVFLLVILILGVITAALSFKAVDESELKTSLDDEMKKLFKNYSSNADAKKIIDDAQLQFHCCGVDGPDDYKPGPLPPSCCGYPENSTNTCNSKQGNLYTTGCLNEIWENIAHFLFILGGIAIGLACILVFGIITGFCLACSK